MSNALHAREKLLVIDTCGERAAVGLSVGSDMVSTRELLDRTASAQLLAAVRALLAEVGWSLADLDGVGVVSGPGSFTGMRVGLAAAKGLCESSGLAMATASRLAVLAGASRLEDGFAALFAGRDELYVREQSAHGLHREFLCGVVKFRELASRRRVVVVEARVAEALADLTPALHCLQLSDALPQLLQCLQIGGSDVGAAEANYVRGERQIYRQPPVKAGAVA